MLLAILDDSHSQNHIKAIMALPFKIETCNKTKYCNFWVNFQLKHAIGHHVLASWMTVITKMTEMTTKVQPLNLEA